TDATEVLLGSEAGEVINGNGGYYDVLIRNRVNGTITSGATSAFLNRGAGGDGLLGGAGNDRLRGRGGDDVMDGGDGIDRADYRGAAAGVTGALSTQGTKQ